MKTADPTMGGKSGSHLAILLPSDMVSFRVKSCKNLLGFGHDR